jgi:D-aspartate ligase
VVRTPAAPPAPRPASPICTASPRTPTAVPRLVIVLGMSETGLGAMRLLARRGASCWGVDATLGLPGFRSRYCQRRIYVPTEMSAAELAAILRVAVHGERERPVILPTSDRFVKLLSDAREALADRFDIALPPAAVVDDLLDKHRFARIAEAAGIRVPRTVHVPDPSALLEAARQVGYPAVVKPRMPAERDHSSFPKAVILQTEDDARALLAAPRSGRAIPELVVQEYIPGDDTSHLSVAMALDARSRPVATFVARKRRQANHGAGVGTLVESFRDPEAAAATRTLLQRIGYVGVAEMELKRHATTGELFAIEVNPRLWSQMTLPALLGVDFAFHYCTIAAGATAGPEIEAAPHHASWQDLWSDIYWTFGQGGYWHTGEVSLRSFVLETLAARARPYFAWNDPAPALRHVWKEIVRAARGE